MAKIRVSIYIEESVWNLAQTTARERAVLFKESVSASRVVEDAIRAIADQTILEGFDKGKYVNFSKGNSVKISGKNPKPDLIHDTNQKIEGAAKTAEMSEDKLKKILDKKRKEAGKPVEQVPVKKNTFFNQYSKDQQLGKGK